jgi:2-polyprenyl-6-methoxyphenol hydroxylase-like FAD-dependent oxidoreductase
MTRVHIVGAGPVGLLLAALLQSSEQFALHLYEKRRAYTRTRMVKLASYLVADSVESYCTDSIDDESIHAIFDPSEIDEGLAFRRSIAPDLMTLLRQWALGFVPLNAIERSLSDLIDARAVQQPLKRTTDELTFDEVAQMLRPDDVLIDCTGSRSLLRDRLVPDATAADEAPNTFKIRLEYAMVVTFLYGQVYDCNEFCKYYKNIGNARYKFIPAVSRTCYDGHTTHVTGIVSISAEDYEKMPAKCDGAWLRANFSAAAESMDRFIGKIKEETHGEVIGDLEIIRIPLDLYRARHATSRLWRQPETADQPFARSPVFLLGDAAMGSPYFQSISLGFECAMFLAGLLRQRHLSMDEVLDRYEALAYKQWLRVYMRSKMIKHNKDLLQSVGDTDALLDQLHLY